MLAACQSPDMGRVREVLGEVNRPGKAASLQPWQGKEIQGQSAQGFAKVATALMVPSTSKVTIWKIEHKQTSRKEAFVHFNIRVRAPKAGDLSISSAVPVTDDGYFLTAAHCLEEVPMQVMVFDRSLRLAVRQARVVWRGDADSGGPDLALLHVPVTPLMPVALAPWEKEAFQRQPVISAGWSGTDHQTAFQVAGGTLRSESLQKNDTLGITWKELLTDVPFAPGDSGGPLLDGNGKLLGINSAGIFSKPGYWWYEATRHQGLLGRNSESISPDPKWIQQLIEKDRARPARSRQGKR